MTRHMHYALMKCAAVGILLAALTLLFVPAQASWAGQGAPTDSSASALSAAQVEVAPATESIEVSTQSTSAPGVRYRLKREQVGWGTWVSNKKLAGSTRNPYGIVGLQMLIDRGSYQGNIAFRMHLTSGKWGKWSKGKPRFSKKNMADGIQVKLLGDISKAYSVEYWAYIQGIGWQRKMHDGDTAGAIGKGMKIQALRVRLVSKNRLFGWVKNGDGSFSYYRAGKPLANTWLVTEKHPIETTVTSGLQRYWIDATGKLAVARYVDPNTQLDSNAGWTAYATTSGFVGRGKFYNDDGLLLADNEGSLFTKTRWVTTDMFDGSMQRYRVVKKGVCAVVKTGLFKVKGKKYYGYPDGRGYLMRSTVECIGKTWYEAGANGVLRSLSKGSSSIIDRYVNWAVAIANDESHGYSQYNRWGPDYDCSSFVCSALLAAGFPNSGATWTGNMKSLLKKIGFVWHKGTDGLQRGDIMLVHSNLRQHTEIYIGDNMLVGAHIAETGDIDGVTGDQTGNEISVTSYYNAPWQGYLRYQG